MSKVVAGGTEFLGLFAADHLLERFHDIAIVGDLPSGKSPASEGELPPCVCNAGTDSERNVNLICKLLRENFGKNLSPQHGTAKHGEQTRGYADPAPAERSLGWCPKSVHAPGLMETLLFFAAPARGQIST